MRDLTSGTTTCVSLASDGSPLSGFRPSVNRDGTKVVFASDSGAGGCPGAFFQILVRDRTAGTTTCASVAPDGTAGNGNSYSPTISADGRFVAFQSVAFQSQGATNLAAPCGSGPAFVRDLTTGTTTCVSLTPGGTPVAVLEDRFPVRLSADGALVAFASTAATLVPDDTNGVADVFVVDLTVPVGLTVNTAGGTGTGMVSSAPAGIACPPACDQAYTFGRVVTLTAAPDPGVVFTGWTGDADCADGVAVMSGPRSCTANFQAPVRLTVNFSGSGDGTVASAPAGIACSPTCEALFPLGTPVTLTATAAPGSIFTGWSGSPGCPVIPMLTANASCLASFTRQFTLTVVKAGAGSGTVISQPPGISCGTDCARRYDTGTVVQLVQNAASGFLFAGWSGDPDCTDGVVTMTADRTCTATFAPPASLTVSTTGGSGSGRVLSLLVGIVCGTDCAEMYPVGVEVSLIPLAAPGSVFAGFGGAADCADGLVRLAGDTACTATFSILAVGEVSLGLGGAGANGESGSPAVSADGDFVVFESTARNLVPLGCTDGQRHVFRRDRVTGATLCVSVGTDGTTPANGPSRGPSLSGDGRMVVFESEATNLVGSGCVLGGRQVFARDLETGATRCLSVTPNGVTPGNGPSGAPVVSADGQGVAFESEAWAR